MSTLLTALPSAIRAKAAQAIAAAFPGAEPQSLAPLHGGLSGSPVYKLVVDGRPFVMRIMQEVSLLHNPLRQLTSMQLASERSITPHVHYVDLELAVSISAFVEHQPALSNIRRDSGQAASFGALLRRLHSGPAFPEFLDGFQMIQGGLEQLAKAGVVLPSLLQEILAEYEPVTLALQPHLTSAPCHNDLNPGNVLYDGQRFWLIDWEGACMGDPMLDLAGVIHWFMLDARQEATLLQAYFQRSPNQQELAKLALMKQVSWCLYALIFLMTSMQGEQPRAAEPIDRRELPSFGEALGAIGRGEMRLQEADMRRRLSLVMAKQSLDEMSRPEFRQALAYLKAA
jgi:aminoglycoside phosphotransferase (APT) family kinase protein